MRVDITYAAIAVLVLRGVDYSEYPAEQVTLETAHQKGNFDRYLDTLDRYGHRYKVTYWRPDGTPYYDSTNWE